MLGPGRVGEVIGDGPFTTAIFEPEGFGIQPARFVFGLASRAAAAGARLVANCEAIAFEKDGSGFRGGDHEGADERWRDRPRHQRIHHRSALGRARRRIVPVGSYIVVTELIADRATEIFRAGR